MKRQMVTIMCFLSVFLSCTNSEKQVPVATKAEQPIFTEKAPASYFIKNDEVYLLSDPTNANSKIINKKATAALKETTYLEVDTSCEVKILEKNKDWVKIQVINPDWLSDSHIGWISGKDIKNYLTIEKDPVINESDYKILITDRNPNVVNYYIQINKDDVDKAYLQGFVSFFRKVKTGNSNIYFYVPGTDMNLMTKYPLSDSEYLRIADQFIAESTFDAPNSVWMYPYQDIKYKELGGKNWKREPIK